jgi:hypothetical protein
MRSAQDAAVRGGDGKIANHSATFLLMLSYFTFGRTKRKTDAPIWWTPMSPFASVSAACTRRRTNFPI